MVYKIYGPPGTGKTYRLISRAKAYARVGTPLHKIGYFAFTKKAAGEAKKRMPAEDKKLPYFQTLHSFAFNLLKLNEDDVMQPYHYENFGKKLNVKVKYYDRYNEEETNFLTCDNPYFQLIHRAINRCVDIREEFDRGEHNSKEVEWPMLEHIHENYLVYKDKKKMMDFNDMIEMLLKKDNKIPKFDAVFIDEAQDLSPLQWKLYDKLKEKSKDIYLAGDDDQAIFAWAGADVNRFINEPAKEKVLHKSRRISKVIQEQSQMCIENIVGNRKEKKYYPRDFDGNCEEIANLDQIDLTEGKWLILTRTVSRLMKIEKELIKKNLYFESNRGKSIRVRAYNAIKNYELLQNNIELEEKDIKDIKEYTGTEEFDLKKDWYEAFQNIEQEDKDYLSGLIEAGEDLSEPARIWTSTIHAIKGGEQDNVILCLDMGTKILKAIKKSQDKDDEEHRVWYVAVTRAKNNLYKLKARIKAKGYKL